jgi:hypothetical protein
MYGNKFSEDVKRLLICFLLVDIKQYHGGRAEIFI